MRSIPERRYPIAESDRVVIRALADLTLVDTDRLFVDHLMRRMTESDRAVMSMEQRTRLQAVANRHLRHLASDVLTIVDRLHSIDGRGVTPQPVYFRALRSQRGQTPDGPLRRR